MPGDEGVDWGVFGCEARYFCCCRPVYVDVKRVLRTVGG